MEVSAQQHTMADLPQERTSVRGTVGPKSRSGYYGEQKKSHFYQNLKPPTGQVVASLL
jgi:hypothetical protein